MSDDYNRLLNEELGLDEQEQETTETETPEEQGNPSSEDGQVNDAPQDPVISEEFAKEYHLPNWLVGKPFNELGKSYREAQLFISKGKHKEKDTPHTETEREKPELNIPDDILANLPDPLDEPEAFKREFAKVLIATGQSVKAELLKEFQPYFEPIREMKANQQHVEIANSLKNELGIEDAELKETLESFMANDPETVAVMQETYAKHPKILIRDIKIFHEQNKGVAKKKEKGADTQRQVIRSMAGQRPKDVSPSVRAEEKTTSELNKQIFEILGG